jgi:cell wall-associated NlpC family hydrolase
MKSTGKWFVISSLMVGAFFATTPDAEAAPTLRSKAMASADTQKGAKYVYGAEGGYSKGYDCSGLIYWSYKKHGKTLPRTAQAQYNKSKHITWAGARPGDLVFIRDGFGHVYHVGVYTGVKNGHRHMTNANTGSYRGRKVVDAPIYEYTAGPDNAVIGQY